jgi:hypothetical protein
MQCSICGKTNVPLYRNAPKGQPAKWSCIKCVEPVFYPEKDVVDISKIALKALKKTYKST